MPSGAMKQNFFATLDTSRNVVIEYMQRGDKRQTAEIKSLLPNSVYKRYKHIDMQRKISLL